MRRISGSQPARARLAVVRRRWDTDQRGHGVASASEGVGDLDRLRAAMLEPDWVAEDPEHHLLPHVERACRERGWSVRRAEVVDAVLEVDVLVAEASLGARREVAFALIGTFAEASTHVVDFGSDRDVELVVTTGMLPGDGAFAPHGHLVRLAVRSA